MLEKTKGQGGITLVALVVTIVVLLILAGITIALVFSQNGVVGKAQEAAKQSNAGVVAENIQDAITAAQIEALATGRAQTVSGDINTGDEKTKITLTGTINITDKAVVSCTGITATFETKTYNISYENGAVKATQR